MAEAIKMNFLTYITYARLCVCVVTAINGGLSTLAYNLHLSISWMSQQPSEDRNWMLFLWLSKLDSSLEKAFFVFGCAPIALLQHAECCKFFFLLLTFGFITQKKLTLNISNNNCKHLVSKWKSSCFKKGKKKKSPQKHSRSSHSLRTLCECLLVSRPKHIFCIAHLCMSVDLFRFHSYLNKGLYWSGHTWYTACRLWQNKQKITEVLVAVLLFFYHF